MLPGRLDLRGDGRGVAKLPHLFAATQRQPIGTHGQTHRAVESAHERRQPSPGDPGDQQLVGLVGADQQATRQVAASRATKLSV